MYRCNRSNLYFRIRRRLYTYITATVLACAGAEAIDRASRTKLGHFTSSTEIAVESRRGEYGTLNGIERIFVEWKIRYSKIIDAQYRWCFPSMDFSKRLWRCRPFPSTIRRNNNRGCKWTRVEPAHETKRRDTGSKVHRAPPNAG